MTKISKRMKYPDGGKIPPKKQAVAPATTPIVNTVTPPPKPVVAPPVVPGTAPAAPGATPTVPVKLTPQQIKDKYKTNPYVNNGRETWGASLDKTLPQSDGVTVRDAVNNAAKTSGVDASLLYSSAMEEGLGFAINKPDDVSTAYSDWSKKNQKLADQFPVDGFYNYGLDTFGNSYNTLKKYLPEGFDKKFSTFDATNEKGQTYKSAAFASDQDALIAKGAMIKNTQDTLDTYAKSKNLTLTPEQRDFFTLAGYNSGLGNLPKIVDSYNDKGYLKDNAFLDPSFKPASYASVYTNVQRRLQNRNVLNGEHFFKEGGRMQYENGTEDPIDPITGKPKQIPAGNDPLTQNMWGNNDLNPQQVPINPDAPKNEQIFRVDEKGNVQQEPKKIIPLSQFYDQSTDSFGNKILKGTGKYTNDKGEVNTQADQNQQNQQVSLDNLANANQKESGLAQIEKAATIGITALNRFFGDRNTAQEQRTNQRNAIMAQQNAQILNPYLEGTGSQAIMEMGGKIEIDPKNKGKFTASAKSHGQSVQGYAAHILANKDEYSPTQVKRANFARNAAKWHEKGGKIDGAEAGYQITDGGKTELISASDHSNPMVEFQGKEHTEGGIGVAYGQNIAEVEDKEIGWVDKAGGLNIFGKLKLPGTNQTFRKTAKDIAEQENKVDGMKSKYLNILNNGSVSDPYQETARSTAKVMFKSLDNQAKDIAEKKEALASYQHLILTMADAQSTHMKYGGRMEYANGGKVDPNDPAAIQKIIDHYSGGKSPLSAQDFIDVAKKYNVPLDLMLAQAIAESNIGTQGRAVKTKNIFNVGNTDNGSNESQDSWKAGLERYAKLIKNEYASNPDNVNTQEILNNNFVRPKLGGKYASEPKYTSRVLNILNDISPEANYTIGGNSNTAAGGPYPKTFKQFKGKDGTQYSSPNGLTPDAFYKDPDVVKALKADQTFPKAVDDSDWGIEHQKVWDALPQSKKDELLNKSKVPSFTPAGDTHDFVPKYQPINQVDKTLETKYGAANRNPTEFSDKVNLGQGDRKRGFLSPLALEQIAPELLTIATNKRDAVPQLEYQPDLKQTFDISYQLGRNENQSSFNQAAKIAESTGNVDALSQLAAQKYKADEAYNMQEVQGNATQKLGVYNQNVDTLNDARLKNLALIADQQTKIAQAKFNTRKEDLGAFASISGKVLQNNLENRTYNAYANLFKNYGFDKKGNVTFDPDAVTQKFNAGEAQQFGLMAAQQGASAIMNGDFSRQFKKVKNEDGSTTTTETLGNNKKIQEEYKTLKNQGFDDGIIGNMLRAKYPETISGD